MDPAFYVVDAYLTNCYGLSLERFLIDAAASPGTLAIGNSVRASCFPIGSFMQERGTTDLYQGTVEIEGVTYRFRCSIRNAVFGERFLESVGEFTMLRWRVRLAVPDEANITMPAARARSRQPRARRAALAGQLD